jgi:starch synthase
MIAMRYGTAPIVHAVGGLADTVRDFDPVTQQGNGFTFNELTPDALVKTTERAVSIYRERKLWQALIRNAMREDFSWEKSAQQYEAQAYAPALRLR